jgi:hypothetical protein
VCAASNGESLAVSGEITLRGARSGGASRRPVEWRSHVPHQRCDRTWKGCILVQPEVRSCSRAIGDVLLQHAAKACSCRCDDVIKALAPDRSDESFDVGVLLWGARRRQDFLNADGIHVIERMIAIAEEVSRHLVPGERVAKLRIRAPSSPLAGNLPPFRVRSCRAPSFDSAAGLALKPRLEHFLSQPGVAAARHRGMMFRPRELLAGNRVPRSERALMISPFAVARPWAPALLLGTLTLFDVTLDRR